MDQKSTQDLSLETRVSPVPEESRWAPQLDGSHFCPVLPLVPGRSCTKNIREAVETEGKKARGNEHVNVPLFMREQKDKNIKELLLNTLD